MTNKQITFTESEYSNLFWGTYDSACAAMRCRAKSWKNREEIRRKNYEEFQEAKSKWVEVSNT